MKYQPINWAISFKFPFSKISQKLYTDESKQIFIACEFKWSKIFKRYPGSALSRLWTLLLLLTHPLRYILDYRREQSRKPFVVEERKMEHILRIFDSLFLFAYYTDYNCFSWSVLNHWWPTLTDRYTTPFRVKQLTRELTSLTINRQQANQLRRLVDLQFQTSLRSCAFYANFSRSESCQEFSVRFVFIDLI